MSEPGMTEVQCPVCGRRVAISAGFRLAYCSVSNGTSVSGNLSNAHYAPMQPVQPVDKTGDSQ